MTQEKFSAKGAQALFAAALIYSTTGVLVREMGYMWGDQAQVFVRYILVFVFLVLFAYHRKTPRIPKDKLVFAAALGITFALLVLFFTMSVQRTTIANSLFTFYATNLITSFLLGTFILKEKVTTPKIIALLFALAGLSLFSGALLAGSLGIIFGVAGGLCEGVSNVLRKWLTGVDRNAILRMQYGVGTVFVGLVTLFSGDRIVRTVSLSGSIITVVFAIVLVVAAHLLLYGYQNFDVNIGTVIMSMELVFGALLGYIFFKEIPKSHELAGGALILTGSILASIDFSKVQLKGRS